MGDLLARQKRSIKPICGDGNCFFRSIAHYAYNTQEEHARVRKEIVDYTEKYASQFAPLASTRIEQHTAHMRTPGKWATQVEIQAAAEVYGVPIYIYTLTPTRNSYH